MLHGIVLGNILIYEKVADRGYNFEDAYRNCRD